MTKKLSYWVAAGFMGTLMCSAHADVVTGITYIDIPPENVSATSSSSGYDKRFLTWNPDTLDRLWEETGGHGTNPNVGGHWLVEIHDFAPDPIWHVTFDLGAEHNLSEIRIWNWNEPVTITRSTKDFEVVVAGADGVFGDAVLTDVLEQAPGCCGIDGSPAEGGIDFSETFPLVVDNIQFVRIFPLTNYGDTFGVGLAEVRIRGIDTGTGIPGDYDGNGTVEPADYDQWKSTFGAIVDAGSGADGNGNTIVDTADYTVWRDNLGLTAGSGSISSIPEPASISLLVLSTLSLGMVARFQRRLGKRVRIK